jgi:hypothetical protein
LLKSGRNKKLIKIELRKKMANKKGDKQEEEQEVSEPRRKPVVEDRFLMESPKATSSFTIRRL